VASTGFSLVTAAQAARTCRTRNRPEGVRAEIDVEDSEILADEQQSAGASWSSSATTFASSLTADARGALRMCVEGERHSKAELRRIGEDILGRVTQQYVYHRVSRTRRAADGGCRGARRRRSHGAGCAYGTSEPFAGGTNG
jgi:hypothetical protein